MHSILLTIDVEDWFQVENFSKIIMPSTWSTHELRVEKNVHNLLDIFDHINSNSSKQIKTTFFVLGWVAERLPTLIKEIIERGHEVASHGFSHRLCSECDSEELRTDIGKSKKLLEDITGKVVHGYRAPSFSINNQTIKIIKECGYLYDSSYNSFGLNSRYGKIDINTDQKKGISYEIEENFFEIPISNLRFGGHIFPWGGGGFFRLIPLSVFKKGVKRILGQEDAYLFYLHPWEIDPAQPKVTTAPFSFKFRHYVNIKRTLPRLVALIDSFDHCVFETSYQYINRIRGKIPE